jgi:hypothetical protein
LQHLGIPLTQLTRKDTKFCWSEPQQTSFDALKEALTSEAVLANPEFDKTFILSCEAYNYAISAMLSQEHNGITVKNHQRARLTRWVLKLCEYAFEILHRPGKKNVNADVLSRHIAAAVRKSSESHGDKKADVKQQPEMSLTKDFIRQSQVEDEYCHEIDQALIEGKDIPFFWNNDSVLYYKSPTTAEGPKIVVSIALKEQVIRQHHDPIFTVHQGEKRTINSIRLKY